MALYSPLALLAKKLPRLKTASYKQTKKNLSNTSLRRIINTNENDHSHKLKYGVSNEQQA